MVLSVILEIVLFNDIFYSGQWINSNSLSYHTFSACIFYGGVTILSSSSISSYPLEVWLLLGVSLPKSHNQRRRVTASYSRPYCRRVRLPHIKTRGLLGGSTFLLNYQGFSLKCTFGMADTNIATNSSAGRFVGLVNTTLINWATAVLLHNLSKLLWNRTRSRWGQYCLLC